jgi:hypothetical protein
MKKLIYSAIIAINLLSCAMSFAQEKQIFLDFPASLLKESLEIIHDQEQSYHYVNASSLVYSEKVTKTILSRQANQGSLLTIFHDDSNKVKNLNLYVYDSSGKLIKKFKQKDFYDVSSSSGLVDDSRYLYIDYEPLSYPFSIKYSYEVNMDNTGFVHRWMPLSSFVQSVKKSQVTISAEPGVELVLVEELYDFESVQVDRKSPNNIRYTMTDQAAFDYEPYAPEKTGFLPHVKFSIKEFALEGVAGDASSWEAFGKWYYNQLLQDRVALNDLEKSKVQALVSGIDDPVEKTKILYEYMQSKTRYISIQLGIGGWQPEQASEVSRLGYGDCKGLSNYMHALLKEAGIESYHTIIYGGSYDDRRDIDGRIVGLQGNHMILNVPIAGEDYWLECTSQTVPFGHLGSFTGDRDVVVLRPEGGVMKRTRIYDQSENQKRLQSQIQLTEAGGFKADINIKSTGVLYDRMQALFLNEKPREIELIYKNTYDRILKLSIDEMDFKDHKNELTFEESIQISSPQFGKRMGNMYMFSAVPFEGPASIPSNEQIRELDFEVYFESIEDFSYTFELPPGYVLEGLPEDVHLESPYGNYDLIIKTEGETIIVQRSFSRNKGRFKAEDYDDFRNFRKEVNRADNAKILIKKQV